DFFVSSRRRHTRSTRDWSSDVCSSDLGGVLRCAVGRSDGEESLAIFVNGEEAAMKAVDVGHELLREKNTQAKRAGMRVENIDARSEERRVGQECRTGWERAL